MNVLKSRNAVTYIFPAVTPVVISSVTTVQAIGILNEANVRGKKRKAVIDTVAATLILEEYLEYRKKHR